MKNTDIERIYMEHAKMIYGFLLKLSENQLMAEELTQETFFQAFLSLDRFHGDCRITTWLCQIAKNVWFNYLKKEKHYKYMNDFHDNFDIDDENDPIDYIVRKSQKSVFYEALHKIPQDMREVVYLKITNEFTFAEIGRILGKSEVWARTNYYRAKQKIMKEVHGYED